MATKREEKMDEQPSWGIRRYDTEGWQDGLYETLGWMIVGVPVIAYFFYAMIR